MSLSHEFFIADISTKPMVIYAVATSPAQAILKRNRWQKPDMDMRILRKANDGTYVDVTEGTRG